MKSILSESTVDRMQQTNEKSDDYQAVIGHKRWRRRTRKREEEGGEGEGGEGARC